MVVFIAPTDGAGDMPLAMTFVILMVIFLIWFINKKIIDFETVCHEASHVSTEAFNFLGEEVKNSEPFSYLNGWIGRKCEEVKIGIAEDKLIWESK